MNENKTSTVAVSNEIVRRMAAAILDEWSLESQVDAQTTKSDRIRKHLWSIHEECISAAFRLRHPYQKLKKASSNEST